jgi:hypothetical protein
MSLWLAAAYALLALGVGWALARSGDWRSRAVYAVCAPLVALGLWLGRPDPAGWPSRAAMPAHAQLLWAQVKEPDAALADPGRIYLWVDLGAKAPRAYSIPYTRPLHEQVQRALTALQHGTPVGVARSAAGPRRSGRHGVKGPHMLRFLRQPPVVLPPKTHDSP